MRVHLHLPKTAGTALNVFLQERFNVYNYGRSHVMSEKEIKKIKNGKYSVLIGHISIKEIIGLGVPLSDVFTIMRHPIDRCISWYYYMNCGAKIFGRKVNMKQFFQSGNKIILRNCYNRQTYQTGDNVNLRLRDKDEKAVLERAKQNVDKFYHVFIFENLKKETKQKFGFVLPKRNKTKAYKKKEKLDDSVIELIKKWNKLDIELYNYVVQKHKNELVIH